MKQFGHARRPAYRLEPVAETLRSPRGFSDCLQSHCCLQKQLAYHPQTMTAHIARRIANGTQEPVPETLKRLRLLADDDLHVSNEPLKRKAFRFLPHCTPCLKSRSIAGQALSTELAVRITCQTYRFLAAGGTPSHDVLQNAAGRVALLVRLSRSPFMPALAVEMVRSKVLSCRREVYHA